MVFLLHLEQSLHPISRYDNPTPCTNASSHLYGSPAASSSVFYRTISTKRKSKAESKEITAKNHSEAERRRRLRINSRYEILKGILPNIIKTDKANILKETLRYLNELKKSVKDVESISPSEEDSLKLSYSDRDDVDNSLAKVVFSCQDRSELISEVAAAVRSAKAKVSRAEIVTLAGRTKCVLRIQGLGGKEGMERLRRALKPVVHSRSIISMSR